MERIFIYPYDQHSEGATKVAKALECQKLLRRGSRYQQRDGDVIVNWGASDCPYPWAINADLRGTIDKRIFFERVGNSVNVPIALIAKRGLKDRVEAAKNFGFRYPVLCRTKVKAHDGDGIVIAENADQLVDAPLYVELRAKTAEYRVHMARKDGQVEILGVQQKFLPKERKDKDIRIRTTANGCYFAWTVDGEPVVLPPQATLACLQVFEKFPELTFGGFDVIYNKPTNEAFVIEINSAPELTDKAAEMYAEFFNRFRVPQAVPEQVEEVDDYYDNAVLVIPDSGRVLADKRVAYEDAPIDENWYIYLGAEAEPQVEAEPAVEDYPKNPMELAYDGWIDQHEGQRPMDIIFVQEAFAAGWKARKEADYALIYNG